METLEVRQMALPNYLPHISSYIAEVTLSGFSVGFCINEEKVICYQLELGK